MKYPLEDEKEPLFLIKFWHLLILILFILFFAFTSTLLASRAFYIGLCEQNKGNSKSAIILYKFSLLLNPSSAKALRNLCSAEIDEGHYSQAIKYCSEGLNLHSTYLNATRTGNIDSDLLNNRGLAFLSRGQLKEALSDFNKALKIDPQHLNAYCNRGCLQIIQGNPEEGLNDFNKVLAIEPDNELVTLYKEKCKPDSNFIH